jgi:hypothetical protein
MEKPPFPQAGFTDAQRIKAMEIRARIQAGENIPLDELKAFLLSSEEDFKGNRLAASKPTSTKPPPKTDSEIDFF